MIRMKKLISKTTDVKMVYLKDDPIEINVHLQQPVETGMQGGWRQCCIQ